jgi:3-isopropylmalate dehydratase small subunit
MLITGHAHKLGDHIDTDVIIPARYLTTIDPAELAKFVFEDLDPSLRARVNRGDILVAGENFGQGSSREHAPIAIRGLGISCIVASSFARIFYRNAFNIGLPVIECSDAHRGVTDGNELAVDLAAGTVRNVTRNEIYAGTPVPEFMQQLLTAGGLVGYVRAELARRRQPLEGRVE